MVMLFLGQTHFFIPGKAPNNTGNVSKPLTASFGRHWRNRHMGSSRPRSDSTLPSSPSTHYFMLHQHLRSRQDPERGSGNNVQSRQRRHAFRSRQVCTRGRAEAHKVAQDTTGTSDDIGPLFTGAVSPKSYHHAKVSAYTRLTGFKY